MAKLYAMGEMLIDFTPAGEGCFRRNAGGAPANVAVAFARLGGQSAVVSSLGEDFFGDFLVQTVRQEGVDASFVRRTARAQTGLAFVSLDEKGDRSFAFWHDHAADRLLEPADIPFAAGDALHFGSIDLCGPALAAHERAIAQAKAAGALVSFDPNLRYALWSSRSALLDTVARFLPRADVAKVSAEELADIAAHLHGKTAQRSGAASEAEDARILFCGDLRLLFVTRGAGGAAVYTREGASYFAPACPAACVDATGAGDAFTGAMLYCLLHPSRLGGAAVYTRKAAQGEFLQEVLCTANRAASFAIRRSGGIPAMPTAAEVFGAGG